MSNAQRTSRIIRRSIAPVIETLETRRLMSLSYITTADPDGNPLLVITSNNSSSSRNETLNITEDPSAGTTTISGSGIGLVVLPDPNPVDGNSGWDTREIVMRDGNDTVNINVTNNFQHDRRSYIVDLGEGDDDAFYNAQDLRYGTSIDIEFDCDGGNDDVSFTVDDIVDSSLVIEAHGDSGSDDFIVNIDDVGELGIAMAEVTPAIQPISEYGASTVDIEISTESSNYDTINTILDDVLPESLVVYDLKLGSGNDKAGMIFNGLIFGDLEVDLSGETGNDELKVQLNEEFSVGAPLLKRTESVALAEEPYGVWCEGTASFNLNGNDNNDKISVVAGRRQEQTYLPNQQFATQFNGNGSIPIARDAELRIRMIGGAGDDYLTLDLARNAGVDIQGLLYLRMDGSHGADTLLARIDTGYCSSGTLDGDMRGGGSNDKLYLFLDVPVSAPAPVGLSLVTSRLSYGPAGFFLMDGGTGTDKGYLELNGNPIGAGAPTGPVLRRSIENSLLIDPT